MDYFSIKVTPDIAITLRKLLLADKWLEIQAQSNSQWCLARGTTKAIMYRTGTFLIQGPDTEVIKAKLDVVLLEAIAGPEGLNNVRYTTHAGLDESGKGDIFGPLVTACVIGDTSDIRYFEQIGVKDSKKLSDSEIFRLEANIRASKSSVIEVCAPCMSDYNLFLGQTCENLNNYLAMLHVQALRRALARKPAKWGLLDKFAGSELIEAKIHAPNFDLQFKTQAESDTVVAAASIIARATQLRSLQQLSEKFNIRLLRGASNEVIQLLQQLPKHIIRDIAKLNFNPVQQRLNDHI